MGSPVTDPTLLEALNSNVEDRRPHAVTDPELLKQLNAPEAERPSSYLGPIAGAAELGARGINAIAQSLPEGIRPAPRAPQPLPYGKLPFVGEPSNRGLYESLKDAVKLPGEVMAGKVDPLSEEGIHRSWG